MKKAVLFSLSILFWFYMVIICAIMFGIALLVWFFTILFDKRLFLLHKVTTLWSYLWVAFCPFARIEITGKENIDKNQVYIMVSNHQSLIDIVAVYLLSFQFKWVAKAELFKIPGIGWNMRLNRYIQLHRGNFSSVKSMIQDCKKTIDDGSSIMMFPEGTRARNGKIRQFKSGAFELALATKKPILPIVIFGSADATPNGMIFKSFGDVIKIKVLKPIPYEQFQNETSDKLTNKVQTIISHELELIQG